MKKIMVCLFVFITTLTLVGCSNSLTCTSKEERDDTYDGTSIKKVIFDFDDKGKVSKQTNFDEIMFDDKETADAWYQLYKSLGGDSSSKANIKGKTLSIEEEKTVTYDFSKEELIKQYEELGYTCK